MVHMVHVWHAYVFLVVCRGSA